MKAVMARKEHVSANFRNGVEGSPRNLANCTVYNGHARFESAHTMRVGDETICAEEVYLNVGGRASVPDFPGVDAVPFLTNVGILALETLPSHLIVVGGSYVGLEFAQIFRRFGSKVTIVEKGSSLASREDPDVSACIKEFLEQEGISVRLSAECIRPEQHGDGVAVAVDCREDPSSATGSHILLAVGRRPNTDDLGLERAGIDTDERGYVRVDDELRTNVKGVWAMGDCYGKGALHPHRVQGL
jgi:pyruvate/2-oxoglutarate dehydrogenase complex dihydrolipoamide dehydrogenase (E3) component